MENEKKIIGGFLVIWSMVVFLGCATQEESTFLLDDLKGVAKPIEGTVDTPEEVLEVLKANKVVDVVALEDVEGNANSNMIVTVLKQPEQWNVHIKTRTAIPAYSCEYAMDENGKPLVGNDYVVKKCDWETE
jgi:hypothetical protein